MNTLKLFILAEVILAVIFCLSSSPVTKTTGDRGSVEAHSDMRKINGALISYYSRGNHEYPDDLEQLIEEEILKKDDLSFHQFELHYVKGWDPSNGDKINLYTSALKGYKDKVLIGHVDGSVHSINEKELKARLVKEAAILKAFTK